MIDSLDISASALVAQRIRLDAIAGNIANAHTTHQEDGTPIPFRRRIVTFAPGDGAGGPGVHVAGISRDPSPFRLVYDPTHPDRIRDGPLRNNVQYPNVNITMEYVDAMSASRAYEANIAMMNITKGMVQQAIRLFA
ncbi:MAG: flagellar basal body rod protein FlgC [Planctomycetes bacterium]|nr:flagellar basal body rod protein FlgC [Planctomycetota bacterium]